MIPLAPGHYQTLTKFTQPWEFYIQDSFLPQSILDLLICEKDIEKKYTLIDKGFHYAFGKSAKRVIIVRNNSLSKQIENVVSNKIKLLLPDVSYIKSSIVCCEPNYYYNEHRDHPDKYISIVIFLHPSKGNGTVLLDDNKTTYSIGWKVNRALIFKNNNHGLHYYFNNTENNRYTLNIYVTKDQSAEFAVTTLLK